MHVLRLAKHGDSPALSIGIANVFQPLAVGLDRIDDAAKQHQSLLPTGRLELMLEAILRPVLSNMGIDIQNLVQRRVSKINQTQSAPGQKEPRPNQADHANHLQQGHERAGALAGAGTSQGLLPHAMLSRNLYGS